MTQVKTLNEVTTLLQCSKAHVSKLVNGQIAGVPRLPVIQIGRRKLVRRESLEVWLREAEGSAGESSPVSAAESSEARRAHVQRRKARKEAGDRGVAEGAGLNPAQLPEAEQTPQAPLAPPQGSEHPGARQVLASLLQGGVLKRASELIRSAQPGGVGECLHRKRTVIVFSGRVERQ